MSHAQNKCNVGYAFINLLQPQCVVPLVERFNNRKWEKFNSEKASCRRPKRTHSSLPQSYHCGKLRASQWHVQYRSQHMNFVCVSEFSN